MSLTSSGIMACLNCSIVPAFRFRTVSAQSICSLSVEWTASGRSYAPRAACPGPGPATALPRGDRREVLRPQQCQQCAAVDDRQAALAQLDVGARQPCDLAREVRLVADEQGVAA